MELNIIAVEPEHDPGCRVCLTLTLTKSESHKLILHDCVATNKLEKEQTIISYILYSYLFYTSLQSSRSRS